MLKFGFIGCGKISNFHADTIRALGHSIISVSARPRSKNIDAFSSQYSIANKYDDWREMLKREKLDALIVALTWNETEKIIKEVINKGIPCLVEKPIALCTEKLSKIIEETQPYHSQVMVSYNRRFYDFIPIVQQALSEKELLSVELNFPEAADNIIKLKSKEIAEHILIYMSSHWLDLLSFIIGEIKVVWMDRKLHKDGGYAVAYNGVLTSNKYNVPIHLQANFNTPSNTSITFNFTDSIYELCPIEVLTIYKGMDIVNPTEKNPIRRYIPRIENTYLTDTAYKPGFFNQMKYFIETCVQKTEANKIGCNLTEALTVTRLCEEIKGY